MNFNYVCTYCFFIYNVNDEMFLAYNSESYVHINYTNGVYIKAL